MRLKVIIRFGIGAIVWALILSQIGRIIASDPVQRHQAASQINSYFFEDHYRITLTFEGKLWRPKVGHPLLAEVRQPGEEVPRLRQVGEIASVEHDEEAKTTIIQCWIFPHARDLVRAGTEFQAFRGPEDVGDIMQTLITPELRDRLEEKMTTFVNEHGDELRARFEPLIDQAFTRYLDAVRDDLKAAIDRQQEPFMALAERHYNESVKPVLMPLLEEKATPMVEARIVPILERAGRELWESAPAAGLAWNAFVDELPFTNGDNLEGRLRDWLDNEGGVVIEKYKPQVFAQIETIAGDLVEDEEIRGLLDTMINSIAEDPALGDIIGAIVNEAIIQNPKTPALLEAIWNMPDLQASIRWAAGKAEPYLVQATDMLLLAPGQPKRINPNLARVLRSQILWKDDFWIKVLPPQTDDASSPAARYLSSGAEVAADRIRLTYEAPRFP